MKISKALLLCAEVAFAVVLSTAGCSHQNSAANAPAAAPRTDTAPATQTAERQVAHGNDVLRLDDATQVLQEIMAAPDTGIPQDLLDKSQCVVVVPGLKKGAFIVGAEYGKGYFACRSSSGEGWTAPGCVTIRGGSFGFQIGGEEQDVVLLVMNDAGEHSLLSSQFTVGADASVAAGPVGRAAQADVDAAMRAEILSYSRSRGVFAGIALNGASVHQDLSDNEALYGGRAVTNQQVVEGNMAVPAPAESFVHLLDKLSPRRHEGEQQNHESEQRNQNQ